MIFVESYFERSLKQIVFDKLSRRRICPARSQQLEKQRVNVLVFNRPPVLLSSIHHVRISKWNTIYKVKDVDIGILWVIF